jgi:hypothetical protein
MTGDSVLMPGKRVTLRLDSADWEIVGTGKYGTLMSETPTLLVLEGDGTLIFAHPKRLGRGRIVAEYIGTL